MKQIAVPPPHSASHWTANRLFWVVAVTFAAIWCILPSTMHYGYKIDVIELLVISKQWVWATAKHPMMSAWLLELGNLLTHRAFAAPFIVSACCTVIMLFSIWQVARKALPDNLALIGTFSMLPYAPFTLKSFLFNPNTALMLFWNLSICLFYFAFQTNKKRYWIAAGLAVGLGFHAKYSMILLAAAFFLYSLLYSRFRRQWCTPGPWLALVIAFCVFLPHLIWFFQNEMMTTRHVNNALSSRHIVGPGWDYIVCPIYFWLANFGLLLVSPLLLLVPILGWRWKFRQPINDTEKETMNYLLYCIGIPLLLLTIISGAEQIVRTAYSFPFWFFLGVFLLLRFQRCEENVAVKRSAKLIGITVLILIVVFIFKSVAEPYFDSKPSHYIYPMSEIGSACDQIWDSHFEVPCPYIVSDFYFSAGFAAHAMKDRPTLHCYYAGNIPVVAGTSDEKVKQHGGLILWELPESAESKQKSIPPQWVTERFPEAEIIPEPLALPYKTLASLPPLRLGVAIVAPQ